VIRLRHKKLFVALYVMATAPVVKGESQAGDNTPVSQPSTANIRIVEPDDLPEAQQYWQSLPESVPPLRGFRVYPPSARGKQPPFTLPAMASKELRLAARTVGKRLAFDGLTATLLEVVRVAGDDPAMHRMDSCAAFLWSAGYPVDLLDYVYFARQAGTNPPRLLDQVARRCASLGSEAADVLADDLAGTLFRFRATESSFRAASESGEYDVGLVRLQLVRGDYWRSPGAGGGLDLAGQLVEAFPEARFIATIERKHLNPFLQTASRWPIPTTASFTLMAQAIPVAQWTQDNGKAGVVTTDGGETHLATLVPRYPSRREDQSDFIPGETVAVTRLATTGHRLIFSPLLFQGGNVLVASDAATEQRVLLIGEAEIYRNRALGLTREQVLEMFRIEFGADRCVVLPAVSFHVDFDVTVREHNGRMVAFVNDFDAGARHVLRAGVDVLARAGKLSDAQAVRARNHLAAGADAELVNLVGGLLGQEVARGHGRFTESFAELFSVGKADSGVGNLQRFLLALDRLSVGDVTPAHPHAAAYLRTFSRQDVDQRKIERILADLGWKVVGVPGLISGDHSLSYVNGLHDRDRYLMPAYGGLFSRIDDVAASIFRRELGPEVSIVPILCGESQRRGGAVHCSASIYPRLNIGDGDGPESEHRAPAR